MVTSSSTKWYGKTKWRVYVKLQPCATTEKMEPLYESLRGSPRDVGDVLLSIENEEIKKWLTNTKEWKPAKGTPWNDGQSASVVFVADLGQNPGGEGHLRMRLHPEGKLTKNFALRDPTQLDGDMKKKEKLPRAPKKTGAWTYNCRRDTKERNKHGRNKHGPQGPYVRNACTYARRRKDGEKKTSKSCEKINKDCLLAYARKNLVNPVTEITWNKVWESLNGED